MKRKVGVQASILTLLMTSSLAISLVIVADTSQDRAVKYILATVKAFRTVCSKAIVAHVQKGGVKPSENWNKGDYAIVLNAEFVEGAGGVMAGVELVLLALT